MSTTAGGWVERLRPSCASPISSVSSRWTTPVSYTHLDVYKRQLYISLKAAGVDVLLDDRNERPGVLFAEMELIGIPHRIVVGDRGLVEGKLEYKGRTDTEPTMVPIAEIGAYLKARLCEESP